MKINKKSGIGLLLIGTGAILLFSSLGFDFWGKLMGYLIPILLIALGYYGIKKGNQVFGWIFFVIGLMVLVSHLTWLFGVLIAIGIIAYGISILKRQYSY